MEYVMSIMLLIFGILFLSIGLLPYLAIIYRLIDEKRGNKTYALQINIKEGLSDSIISVVIGIFLIIFHNLIVANF